MYCSGSREARKRKYNLHLHSKAVGRRRATSERPEASRVQPETQGTRLRSHDVGDWSEDLWKAWMAKLHSYGRCREGHVRDVGLHAQKRGRARGITWIAGRRRWSRYGESPRRRNVRDCGREDGGVGLPRRALRAVAVPRGVLCNKRADYEPNLNCLCYPTADSSNPWHKDSNRLEARNRK